MAADGHREGLGFAVGDNEDGAFWTAFPPTLKARGLAGTGPVISNAHTGLKAAIAVVLQGGAPALVPGAVHAQRPGPVPGGNAEMVAAAIRMIFGQPDAEHVALSVPRHR